MEMKTNDVCQKIVMDYINGDKEALNLLPPHIDGMIYSIIKQFSKQLSMDDLYQIAWESIMISIESYDPNEGTKFTTYAYKGIMYRCMNVINKGKNYTVSLDTYIGTKDGTISMIDAIPSSDTTEDSVVNSMYLDYLRSTVDDIKVPKQRDIIRLFLDGMSQRTIANKLDITPAYVSKTLKQYRNKLKP